MKMPWLTDNHIKEVKAVTLIRIATYIGRGTEKDPSRIGFLYYDFDGNLIAITEASEKHKGVYKNVPPNFF